MTLSKKPYRGTRDFFPTDKRTQDYLFSKMREVAKSFAYEPYDGPLLEEVELYKAKSGEELINEQIYSFTDRGERFVAIRPEMTPTVARMVSQIHKEEAKPIRWFSIPNLMRYEKPQKGRLREHWQFNCDIFGAPGRTGEIEILQVVSSLLESYGATEQHFEILINDRAIVDIVFHDLMKTDNETTYKLYKIVDKSKKVDEVALKKMVSELSLPVEGENIFFDYLQLNSFDSLFAFLDKNLKSDKAQEFQQFITLAKEIGLGKYLTYDPTIVRGLDYYTGIVFEIFDKSPENRRAICGGGAYANLLQIFNENPLPGVGFGLGDVTLTDFLKTHNLLPDFSIPENDLLMTFQTEAALPIQLKLANDLRKKGLKILTAMDTLKFKKVFPLAEKKGASFASFLGDQELDDQSIEIKNLKSKDQKKFKLTDTEEIANFIKNG